MANAITSPAHTKGPWFLEPVDLIVYDGEKAGAQSIATVEHDTENARPIDECEANARLIAKAWLIPELLASLEYLLAQTVDMDLAHGIELTEGEDEARRQAIDVMAEAAK